MVGFFSLLRSGQKFGFVGGHVLAMTSMSMLFGAFYAICAAVLVSCDETNSRNVESSAAISGSDVDSENSTIFQVNVRIPCFGIHDLYAFQIFPENGTFDICEGLSGSCSWSWRICTFLLPQWQEEIQGRRGFPRRTLV